MRKILVVLLIIITSLSFSNNLDKYESKRVFDKYIDVLLNGNYEKYKNDPEMRRIFKEKSKIEEIISGISNLEDSKYQVISVKEMQKSSKLTVQVTYATYPDVSFEEKVGAMIIDYRSLEMQFEERSHVVVLLENMYNTYKDNVKKETKIIEVDMNKKNGAWNIDSRWIADERENKELYSALLPWYNELYYVVVLFEIYDEF